MKCPQIMWCDHHREVIRGDDVEAKLELQSMCVENWRKCPHWDRLAICDVKTDWTQGRW